MPVPWRPRFLTNHDGLKNLSRGSSKEHSCQVILYWSSGFRQEDFFLSFLYRYIGKISTAPLVAMFFTNHDGLNNLCRGSPRKPSCNVILKSAQCFLTRRFLKVSI